MMNLILAFVIASGAATYYAEAAHLGKPLYCDQFMAGETLRYDPTQAWVAFDVSWYQSGRVHCGDWVLVQFETGERLLARALDAGRLAGEYADTTANGQRDTGIIVDLPEHLKPDARLSWRVQVINLDVLFDED